ncbi:MAG: PocR ligand-binding domain-containing protein [Planctomycetes bacterium]|nr:PocR ligand-binding domain-containing protein [Planctomycetota bacterium]
MESPAQALWPFRPVSLTELIDPWEIRHLVGFGAPLELQSAVACIAESGESGELVRITPEDHLAEGRCCAFCAYLRRGETGGKIAFEGAEAECQRSEERLARRALSADEGGAVQARCHMGLTEFAAPIIVLGRALGAVVAGQCLTEDDQKGRIAKIVGKIGKLTRGELRSIEESGASGEPPIQVADESAREQLVKEIARIPRVTEEFEPRLTALASAISRLATSRLAHWRARREEEFLRRFPPPPPSPPMPEDAPLRWLRSSIGEMRRSFGLEYVAVFAGPSPLETPREEQPLPLVEESGLLPEGGLAEAGAAPPLVLDPRKLSPAAEGGEVRAAPVEVESVSSLIGALHALESTPAEWKDRLTKSFFAVAVRPQPDLCAIFLLGPPTGGEPPQSDDLGLLARAASRLGEVYLLLLAAGACRLAREKLKRFEVRAAPKKPPQPLPIRPQHFDLRRLIDQCLEATEEVARRERVTIDAHGLPQRLMVDADRDQIRASLDAALRHSIGIARPDDGRRSSILLAVRRERKQPWMVHVVLDVLGPFLGGDARRQLLSEPIPRDEDHDDEPAVAAPLLPETAHPSAASTAPARGDAAAPGGEPPPAGGRPEDASRAAVAEAPAAPAGADAAPPSAQTAPPQESAAPGAAPPPEGKKPPRPPRTFRDIHRYLAWHGGRLDAECVRTDPVEGEEGSWYGRTLITLTFRIAPRSARPERGRQETRRRREARG